VLLGGKPVAFSPFGHSGALPLVGVVPPAAFQVTGVIWAILQAQRCQADPARHRTRGGATAQKRPHVTGGQNAPSARIFVIHVEGQRRYRGISWHYSAFSGRASMLEVQNRALIKAARERAQRIGNLERELQQAGQEVEQLKAEVERLKAEREFYSKRVLALEQHNRELTEAATKYSLWGQKLERELARIDPDGAHERRFGAGDDA
jgi:chromosome segregation ATPase